MIPRYALPEMAELFTDEARLRRLARGRDPRRRGLGRSSASSPPPTPARCGPERAGSTSRRSSSAERVTDHDVAAFVDVVQERVGQPAGAWVHYGLTSSDVVDTALSRQLTRACDLMLDAADELESAIAARAREFRDTADGRPHPRHPRRAHDVRRQARALGAAGAPRPRAACAGRATRSRSASCRARSARYSNVDPAVEAYVCERLGLAPVPATQVIARDRHAELLYACASLGATHRVVRARDPPPAAHRGARGRGAVPRRARRRARARCRTSATR